MIVNPSLELPPTVEKMAQLLVGLTCDLLGGHGPTSLEVFNLGECTYFILRVAHEDLNKLLGPQGRTAESLRVIVAGGGIRQGRHFELKIGRDAAESRPAQWMPELSVRIATLR